MLFRSLGNDTGANPCSGPASLVVAPSESGTDVVISWTGGGYRLQVTDTLAGPATVWTDIAGASPITQPVLAGQSRFYRVVCP